MPEPVLKFREPSAQSKGFEMVDADLGRDTNKEIETWLYEKLTNYIDAHSDLHKSKIPKWRRLYLGTPLSETKSFPFPNASNIVAQIIGDRVDTLTARILGFVFATSPLWHYMYPDQTDSPKDSELKKRLLEEFMDIMGYEQNELNLYPTYGMLCTDHAKLGTAFAKVLLEDCVEVTSVAYTSARKRKVNESQIYYGPRVEKLAHEDVMMDPGASSIEKSRLVTHKRALTRYDLEERAMDGLYDQEAVAKIIGQPDREGPDLNRQKEQRKQGVQSIQSRVNAEWDVYECYFPWIHNGSKFRLIYSYHHRTRTVLRRVFNFIPDNQTPIVRAKLGYRSDGAYGYGFAFLLNAYQQGISEITNNAINNSTLANTRFWRVDPNATNIGSQIEIFPNAAITARKDEIEAIQMGDIYQSSFQNIEMLQAWADSRAGIAPAVSGSGAGGTTKGKGNPYSAMGTLALMQEGNHRTNLATSDFRHMHQRIGSMVTAAYAKFGIKGREEMFGKDGKYLVQALEEFLKKKNRIPIRSSNASINKEVEKQNDMLMVGLIQRHYTAQAQVMQAINNPSIPPPVQKYLMGVLEAADRMQKRILKDFGYDQPGEFVPDASQAVQGGGQGAPPQAQPQPQGVDPRIAAALAAAKSGMGQPQLPTGGPAGAPQVGGMEAPPERPR